MMHAVSLNLQLNPKRFTEQEAPRGIAAWGGAVIIPCMAIVLRIIDLHIAIMPLTEHVGFSPNRQALLTPIEKRGGGGVLPHTSDNTPACRQRTPARPDSLLALFSTHPEKLREKKVEKALLPPPQSPATTIAPSLAADP